MAEDSHIVKNSASLSLELFGARTAGKHIVVDDAEKTDHLLEGTLSRLQDTTYTESIFRRDWRESRLEQNTLVSGGVQSIEQDDQLGPLPHFGSPTVEHRSNSRMASPASSIRSRSSAQPVFSTSLRQSPQSQLQRMTGSTASDAIDVDSLEMSTTSTSLPHGGNKRKASDDDVEDEDVQFVQGPVILSQKKQKGKAGKSKKR